MGTVVGLRATDGVIIAGDRRVTRDGEIVSEEFHHVHTLSGACIGTVGEPSAMQSFVRDLTDELRTLAHRRGEPITFTALERITSGIAARYSVPCLIAARDEQRLASLGQVDAKGAATREEVAAIGTGSELAIGALDQLDRDRPLATLEPALRDVVTTVADRDTGTSASIDTCACEDET